MASSRGRSIVTERRERRTFVFGSSTPRDLSYMNKVPFTLRTYDSKPKKTPRLKEEETLTHYMRQARSLTPHLSEGSRESAFRQDAHTAENLQIHQTHLSGAIHYKGQTMPHQTIDGPLSATECFLDSHSRDGSCDRMRTSFAFGSSTPRQFSHLSAITPELRVYDVKIRPKVDKRSYTTPMISSVRSKTVPATARVSRALPPKPQKAKRRSEDEDDEIASEPDFVQDRHEDRQADFMQSIKKQWHAEQIAKKGHPRENGASSVKRTIARKERHVIRTTTNEGGKVKKEVESVKQSLPKHINTVEDEVTDLPVEAAHPCIVPQTISTSANDLIAKSAPTVRPLNDSSEVVVVYDEKTPEERSGAFLGELADKVVEIKDAVIDRKEKALSKVATDDKGHTIKEKGMKGELNGTDLRKNGGHGEGANASTYSEAELEIHTSLNAPSDDRNNGKKHLLDGEENMPVELDISKRVPSGKGSVLSMDKSPQPISPESEAKLTISKAHSNFQHSPEQRLEDLQQPAENSQNKTKCSSAHSEGAHSIHDSMHSFEDVRQHDDSLHSLEEGRRSQCEGMTRSSEETTHSMHESVHSTEDIRSLRKEINSPHPGATLTSTNASPTDDVRSFHEGAHSPQEEVLSARHHLSSVKDIQSLASDDRVPDEEMRSLHESIYSPREDIHAHHHSSHSEEDVHSSHLREKRSSFIAEGLDSSSPAISKRGRSSDSEMDREVIPGQLEYSSTHSSNHLIHSPDHHTEQQQADRSSPGYVLESKHQNEQRSPDHGSYFVQSSRLEMSETRGSTDESPVDESRAYHITSGNKSSEEATRIEGDDDSLKEGDEEDMEEEDEDVSVI